jgi:hypothetical protein
VFFCSSSLPASAPNIGQHIFGVSSIELTPTHEGTQNEATQGGLYLGHGIFIDAGDSEPFTLSFQHRSGCMSTNVNLFFARLRAELKIFSTDKFVS